MKPIRTALAGFAAAGILVAQPAAAADVRVGSPVAESESLAGGVPSAAWPAIIAILVVGIAVAVSSAKDGDADFPVSP